MQGTLINWIAAPLIAALSLVSCSAHADSAGPLSPFPITGAFSADFREDRNHVSVIEFAGNYNKTLPDGADNVEPRAVIAQEFFRTHPDQYDFLVTFSSFEFDTGTAAAFHYPIQNQVKGLGLPTYDVSDLFGSSGKLQGYTDMAALSRWTTDPMDPAFEKVLSVLAHEILHQWGSRVRFRDSQGNLSDALLGKAGAHWSYLLDSDASVGYGADWRDNGDGTFTSVGIRTFYSPLDLYLMGMYGPEEVPPLTLIDNPDIDKTKLPEQGVTINGTARTVTINDIIAAEGPRIPAASASQKEFRMAFILLVAPDEKVDERWLQAMNNIRQAFMTRFSVLTGGRAVAHIYPEAMPVNEVGAPLTVTGGELREGEADLDAAVAWLRQRQQPEGYWSDKSTTKGRDTTVVFEVLAQYDPAYDGLGRAKEWLGSELPASTDYLARTGSLQNISSELSNVTQQHLIELRNADGGWGIAAGYASDPLDTALALSALSIGAAESTVLDEAVEYLVQNQNSDGGWSGAMGGPSRTSVTAEVMLALQKTGRESLPALAQARAWIAAKQNGDGGFGDSPSTAHDTAMALLALMAHNALDAIRPDQAAAYLMRRQTVDGSWAGSSYATALAVAALKEFSFSNWRVESITTAPAAPRDGERISIASVVRNTSGLATPEGVLRIYSGDPNSGGTPIGPDIAIPRMAAGSALTFSRTWDSFDQPGSHLFFAVVDPDALVVETSEQDNSASTLIEIQSAPDAVELEVTQSDITIMPQHPNRLPSSLGVNVNLRNLGQQDASGVRVLLWEGEADTGLLVGETTLDVLGRSTMVANFTYSLERAGVTRLTVQLDPENLIAEAKEDNNLAWAEVILDPSVDLGIDTADIALDRATVLRGQDVTFTVTLHNYGTQPSPPATVRYLLGDGNAETELRSNTVEIAPGETLQHSVSWLANFTGTATFTVELDTEALVAELDENNNVASITFDVGAADGPNLQVGHQDFLFTPNPAPESGAVTLSAMVHNSGTQPASDIGVAFYNGDPAEGGEPLATLTIPALDAGAQHPVSYTWETVPDSADKVMFVVVDPDNTITEFAEDDNRAFNLLPVLSLPDLAISEGDIQISPDYPKVGDEVTVTARIANIGQQPAGAFSVRAYDGEPEAGGTLIGEQSVSALAAGAGTEVHFTVTFDSERTDHPIVVRLDPENAVHERHTDNNIARRPIAVQDGNLFVSNRYFSPNGDGVKDDTQLVVRLALAEDIGIQVLDIGGRTLRSLAGGAGTEHAVTWDGKDEKGRVAADGDYTLRVMTSSGAVLGERVVTLDTNRSSVIEAIESGRASYKNLTCKLDENIYHHQRLFALTEDGETAFISYSAGVSSYSSYINTWSSGEQHIKELVSRDWIDSLGHKYTWISAIAPSADGKRLFFVLVYLGYDYSAPRKGQLWVINSDGSGLTKLSDASEEDHLAGDNISLEVPPDGQSVYVSSFHTGYYPVTYYFRYTVDSVGSNYPGYRGYHTLSPDGMKLWQKSSSTGLIDIVDTTTNQVVAQANLNEGLAANTSTLRYSWSPDSKRLAIAGGVAGSYVVQVFDEQGRQEALFMSESSLNISPQPLFDSSGSELYVDAPFHAIFNLDTGEKISLVSEYGYQELQFDWLRMGTVTRTVVPEGVAWAPGERILLTRDGGAIFLDEQRYSELPWKATPTTSPDMRFPSENAIIYRSSDIEPECQGDYKTMDYFKVESYLNLGAGIDAAVAAGGGLSLRGTASDKNFADYYLEYARTDTPNDWHPVGPASGKPVEEGTLAFWVPPGKGAYVVRLTVTDLAGNVRTVTKPVYWGDPVSISNIYRTPSIFSPNGDGVKDTVRIHYRVLEPVHLEFTIENRSGDVLRSYIRDHSQGGLEHDIQWDGRDERGILLPDGDYTLRVQGYRFPITLDNTAPLATLSSRDAYQSEWQSDNRYVQVNPGLHWEAQDAHLATLSLERGDTDEPFDWQPFTLTSLQAAPQGEADIALTSFTGSRFRLTARDEAGNAVSVISEPGGEQLMITHFGQFALSEALISAENVEASIEACARGIPVATPENWLEPVPRAQWLAFDADVPTETTAEVSEAAPLRIALSESVYAQLVQLMVEYRPHGAAEWQQAPIEAYLNGMDYCAFLSGREDAVKAVPAPPEQQMQIRWGTTTLLPGSDYDLRIRGIDAAGITHYSNVIQFFVSSSSVRLGGLVSETDTNTKEYTEAIAPLLDTLVPPWDRSAEELLWGEQRLEQPVGEARLLLHSNEDPRYAITRTVDKVSNPGETFLFRVPDLRACTTYQASLEVYGNADMSGEVPLLANSREPLTFQMPCIELAVDTKPVFAESCGDPSPKQIEVQLQPIVQDGSELKLLTLSRWDAETGEDIVYNVNQPVAGTIYTHRLDTSALPEGPIEFTATLISTEDKAATEPLTVQIDHTPPQVEFSYPVEGQHVCGEPRQQTDGQWRNVLTLEADIGEANAWHYDVTANGSLIHDSRSLDSFAIANGDKGALESEKPDLHLSGFKSGPVAALADQNGEVSAQIRVYDTGGFMQCAQRHFHFDGTVDISTSFTDLKLISPNGDGESDALTFTHRTDEAVTVDIAIYQAAQGSDGSYSPIGDVVRTLETRRPLLPGETGSVWDGRDNNGVVVAEGDYMAVMTYEDSCGNQTEKRIITTVDATAPKLALISPQTGEALPMIVELIGSVEDLNLSSYNVSFGIGSNPETWNTISSGHKPIVDGLLARWNTYGLAGEYTVRIQARDAAGNTAESLHIFTLPMRIALLNQAEVSPAIFSPNGDSLLDRSTLRLGILEPVLLDVTVTSSGGEPIRSLADRLAVDAGEVILTWDGLNDQEQQVDDNDYTVRITATLQADSFTTQQEKLSLTVDVGKPLINVTQPAEGFASGAGGVVGSVIDPHLSTYSVQLTDSPHAPVWHEIASGSESKTDQRLATLTGLEEREYAMRILAVDEAENHTEQVLPFVIDNTSPTVDFTSPSAGAVFGLNDESIEVQVQVHDDNLSRYALILGEGENPQTWTEIEHGESLPVANPFTSLNISSMTGGTYSLRLIGDDKAGNRAERQLQFKVDITPPVVEVQAPVDGGIITGPTPILGIVEDANLKEYGLYIAPGDKSTAAQWELLAQGVTAVNNDVLLDWSAIPENGIYTLKLEAGDTAGNIAQSLVELTVKAEPPAQPEGLDAVVKNKNNVALSWVPSKEEGIKGYYIYRDDLRINTMPVQTATYLDGNLSDGVHHYSVTAIGYGDMESTKSLPAEVDIDTTPPSAHFSDIGDGDIVSGIVEIHGTAYAAKDFKEYRLYTGEGAVPDTWVLLRQSPLPITNDLLGQWDTTGSEEGSTYTLKLEAEDLTGNTAVVRVSVSIDNTAPAAPTGLIASVSGTDVQLSWDSNSENDVAGYLLLRNGEPLGTGVGATTTDTSFTDTSLADGNYDYTVIALDQAGNPSVPSQPANAVIDSRAPHALIVTPTEGAAFDRVLYVLAQSDDTDIASIELSYRPVGSEEWFKVAADTNAPFEFNFDTATLGLAYGDYALKVVATDTSGKVDPAPTPVTVTYRDLTRPATVVGLESSVNGENVVLRWSANTDSDLAGYQIYMNIDGGEYSRLTQDPVLDHHYAFTALSDAVYTYYVSAIDTSGNESDPSSSVPAVIHTPALNQPYTPTAAATVSLSGSSAVLGTVVGEVATAIGSNPLPEIIMDEQGGFSIADIPLASGANTFTIHIEDNAGNLSKPTSVTVVKGDIPNPPSNLATTVNGYDVSLSWSTDLAQELFGFRVFRDGEALHNDLEITDLSAAASHNNDAASRIFDSPYYIWSTDSSVPVDGQWISVSWPEPKLVTSVALNWYQGRQAVAYDIQGWDGNAWILLKQITEDTGSLSSVELTFPYPTNKIRFVFRESYGTYISVSDVTVSHRQLVTQPAYSETLSDGTYEYTVTAFNKLGLESASSAPASALVGDVTAPEAVQISGSVNGSDVTLSWMPSSSSDVTHYDIYRDDELIAQHTDLNTLNFSDTAVVNGNYTYTVHAIDAAGNISEASNPYLAIVDIELLPAPTGVIINPLDEGEALSISWNADESATGGYIVYQASEPGGPYTVVYEGADPFYTDISLTNGESYFYVVASVDGIGNISANSIVSVGIPVDTQPPMIPVFSHPTVAGVPYETSESTASLIGKSEPGAKIYLAQDGVDIAMKFAASANQPMDRIWMYTTNQPVASPDGRFVAVPDYSRITIHGFDGGTAVTVAYGSSGKIMQWTQEGLVFVLSGKLKLYSTKDGSVVDLLSDSVTAGKISPDGKNIIYHASGYIYLYERESRLKTRLLSSYLSFGDTLRWAPDGQYVAFKTYKSCYVLNTATKTLRKLSSSGDTTSPAWSKDSKSLIYSEVIGGRTALQRYWVEESREESLISLAGHDVTQPVISPQGDSLTYVVDQQTIWRMELFTGETAPLLEDRWSPRAIQWLDVDYLTFYEPGGMMRYALPGRFEFSGVALHSGSNLFTASAEDASGNTTPPSESILIRTSGVNSLEPDLVINPVDISLQPAAALVGNTLRVKLIVKNTGGAPVDGALLSLAVHSAEGVTRLLLEEFELNTLAPGGEQIITAEWTAEAAGDYSLIATVDPEELITEESENNNVAVKKVSVTEDAGPRLNVATEKSSYSANEAVQITADLINYDLNFTGNIELLITDAGGYTAAAIESMAVTGLSVGQSTEFTSSWNTGLTYAGDYRVLARLSSATGEVLAENFTEFTIQPYAHVTSSVTSDKASYGASENIRISGEVNYTGGNSMLHAALGRLIIVANDGSIITEKMHTLGDIMPGSNSNLWLDWNTGTTAPGQYTALVEVTADSESLTVAQSTFDILPDTSKLAGSLQLSSSTPGVEEPLLLTYQLNNDGNIDISNLPVRFSIIDPEGATVVHSVSHSIGIPSGTEIEGAVAINTEGLELKTYTVLLEALPLEGSTIYPVLLSTATFTLSDRTPPQVDIREPSNASYLRDDTQFIVFSNDSHSRITRVEVSIDSGDWRALQVHDVSKGLFQLTVPPLSDGPHTIMARATDAANNIALSEPHLITADNTAPLVDITGVSEGEFYNAEVVPEVQVEDVNLFIQKVLLDGQPYAPGTVMRNGSHTLEVYAEDRAGNITERSTSFTIDTIAPQILVQGIEQGEIYNSDVTPVVTISDTNIESHNITINGMPFTSGTTLNQDGNYEIEIKATDRAGNTTSKIIFFELDKTPPNINITSPATGLTTSDRHINIEGKTEPLAVVSLSSGDYSMSMQASSDGNFLFTEVPLGIGQNSVNIMAHDRAGNSSTSTTLYITVVPPIELHGEIHPAQGVLIWAARNHEGNNEPHTLNLLDNTLNTLRRDHLVVYTENEFISALRTQRYNTVVLIEEHQASTDCIANIKTPDGKPCVTPNFTISNEVDSELRLMTASGTGLLWIKTAPDSNEHWEDLFGAKFLGVMPNISSISFEDGEPQPGQYDISGEALKVSTSTGREIGTLAPGEREPALIVNRYGKGNTVLMTFDPSRIVDISAAKTILMGSIEYATPSQDHLLPGSYADVIWRIEKIEQPISVMLDMELPSKSQFISAPEGSISSPLHATWIREIEQTNADSITAIIKLPEEVGTYTISATLHNLEFDRSESLLVEDLSFQLNHDLNTLMLDTITQIASLQYKKDTKQYEKVLEHIYSSMSLDDQDTKNSEDAIKHLLSAEEILIALPERNYAIEGSVGMLLRSYQLR